jgi:hypothetical protein
MAVPVGAENHLGLGPESRTISSEIATRGIPTSCHEAIPVTEQPHLGLVHSDLRSPRSQPADEWLEFRSVRHIQASTRPFLRYNY